MNQFVKGVKNLALALSFVSVCACSSVENADLNAVNKEFGSGDDSKNNVNGVPSGNVNNGQITVEDCIDENGINFELLDRINGNLSGREFTVDEGKNIRYNERIVFSFETSGRLKDLVNFVIKIGNYGGLLSSGEGFDKMKISFVDDNIIKIGDVEAGSVRTSINLICLLGKLDDNNFNVLFDCSEIEIENGGAICGKVLNYFWDELDPCGEYVNWLGFFEEIHRLFEKGFAFLLGVTECKIKKCKADGLVSDIEEENTRVGIFGGEKYVLLDSDFYFIY